jgi:hypothetical protein
MAAMAQLPTLDAWYVKLDVATLTERVGGSSLGKQLIAQGRKAGKSTAESAAIKLTEVVDGRRRFRSDPPLVVPLWDVADDAIAAQTLVYLGPRFKQYLVSLEPDRAALLRHFEYVDIARKVVGVGSVGTRAGVVLLESGDGEPLLLQMKQASASVLEPHLGASQCATHSERVVVGQRVMQASGDPFLGWVRLSDDGSNDFYVRQLRDMKASVDVAKLDKNGLIQYAGLCGAVLARAHARVGDSSAISGYLGDTDEFDKAIADFALAYADVNDQDYRALVDFGKQTGS